MKLVQKSNDERPDLEVGGDVSEAAGPSPAADADDYPTGATLTLIVLALAMSMFLVALDMLRQNKQLDHLVSPLLGTFESRD